MGGSVLRNTVALLLLLSLHALPAEVDSSSGLTSIQLSGLGDRMFREARFEDAANAYSRAVDLDRNNVRGHLGLGKMAMLLSDPRRAANHYSTAYQLAPRDPDAILAFAGVVENLKARQTLFRNFLAFSNDSRVEDVRAKLRITEQVGSGQTALASPYQSYRIPLSGLRTAALLLHARINGSKEVKLILDTGATGVVLNSSAGSRMHFEFLVDAVVSGFGAAMPASARIATAATFETSGLKLSNMVLNVLSLDLTPDADGVIGLDVFKDFLIRLDPAERALELTPFQQPTQIESEGTRACRDCLQTFRLGHLLLLHGTVNGVGQGYFVLDTGAPFSMVSRKLVSQGGRPAVLGGAQGALKVDLPSMPVSIRFGDRRLLDAECATFDTAAISSRNGTEIAGAIGYSALRNLTLTIDYRAGLVKLGGSDSK